MVTLSPAMAAGLVITGLCNGMLVLLTALGFTMIFGLMGIAHFAHSAVFMWGAYIGWTVAKVSGDFYLGVLAAMLGTAALGLILQRGFLMPLLGEPLRQILVSLGLIIFLGEGINLIWGRTAYFVPPPPNLKHFIFFGAVPVLSYRFFVTGVGIVVILLLHLLLTKTRIGLTVRAATENREMVECLGINTHKVFSIVFMTGSILAGLGGALAAPVLGVSPQMGYMFLLSVLTVVIIGGLGSIWGSVLASLLIGLTQAFVAFFYPQAAAAVSIGLMALVLLLRPHGLLGKPI